jgi:hypothetical protein
MKEERRRVRRRKWKRFETVSGAVVILNKPQLKGLLGIKRVELGPIVNISMGGLAVQYVENKHRSAEYSELSIYFPSEGIVLDRVPFETISDFEITQMPDDKVIRKRCVKFGTLTTYQAFQLEEFIKKNGTKCLEDRRAQKDRRKFQDPRYGDPKYEETFTDRRSGKDRRRS